MQYSADAPLVRSIVTTDRDHEYQTIFAEHRTGLYRFAVLLVGDPHVADELTAEVFAKVLPKWRSGAVTEPLAYLRRALVNEVRSRHRRRHSEQRALERVGSRPSDGWPADRVALAEPLVKALAQLPVRQRAVLVLRFHDDLAEADVARTLDMPLGTVKSLASRGLSALRELLEEPS